MRHAGLAPALALAGGALVWALPMNNAAAAPRGGASSRHVVVVGIGGLLWSDVSPAAAPVLWRLAGQGAVGSLDVSGVRERTCPADGWLTLNGAARAALPVQQGGGCAADLPVIPRPGQIAAALPFLLPLTVVILSSVPREGAAADAGQRAAAAAAV